MTQSKPNQSYLIWWILGVLSIFTLGITTYFYWTEPAQQNEQAQQSHAQKTTQKNLTHEQATIGASNVTTQGMDASSNTALVDEKIVEQAIPQNESLAKDELAKLKDIQTQLDQQTMSLNAQHQDADQLIKLKQEQIKLLEAQLAQSQKPIS
ncbi:hypothetical protein RFI36_02100 [Acinetobacter gerneri]|uniref:Uncharacterized protein n=1 Tax=Acinetobacter gerneri TaxID=202952 RepID=A0AAW8JET9_9GAMM|nr:hypothetical protein [Acinetobacter gerneri]MDQ9008390.1 hypothetical protein [Acinetobacter gerneri]MDQ9012645.1 hypothetical protein [Acinetobacter gerneri]MDQ9024080.1 hypothetical protein [Acinetobacter gerneri]MDQ9050958.1 hypothetical protein [Acinetobacter gerneri]MDQ9058540.1 hypothetical protein [Acinetobacter gerneri]